MTRKTLTVLIFITLSLFIFACNLLSNSKPSPALSTPPTLTPQSISPTPIAEQQTPSQTPALTFTEIPTSPPTETATLSPSPTIPTPTPTETAFPEPVGCLKPEEDYTHIKVQGFTLNQRTYGMLQHAKDLYGGEIDITGSAITQGSYTSSEPASFGTHDKGGAVDFSVLRRGTTTVLWDEIDPLIHVLRVAGFAAWFRQKDELYAGSPLHIHAIAIGDKELSPAAQEQLTGKSGYFYGFSGVPFESGSPPPDRFHGPIICQWMIEMGYADQRLPATQTAQAQP